MGGAPRSIAIVNGTRAAALGIGDRWVIAAGFATPYYGGQLYDSTGAQRYASVQLATILLLIPALFGGVIADEKQRKTMHYLMASRLSSSEIVLDKLAARLLPLGPEQILDAQYATSARLATVASWVNDRE